MDPVELTLHVPLGELIEPESWNEICHSFYDLFEIPVRIFDDRGSLLVGTSHNNPLCQLVNGYAGGREGCMRTRERVKSQLPDAPETTTCFSGLEYLSAPIRFETEVVGKLVLGPYLPVGLERISSELLQRVPELDKARFRDTVGELRRVKPRTATRIIRAIGAVVDVILFSAKKAHVTNQLHLASTREAHREITEKNRSLEALAEEQREFERQKSNFLAMVSHELRTPLTSIIGYSDMLAEGIAGPLAEEQLQFVETIKTKGDELLRLISSILDFSQIDTGHLTLQLVASDIPELIRTAIATNRTLAERRGVKLSAETAPGLPPITLDPEKIRTALGHLIDNAVKFSSPGSVVKVSATVVASTADDGEDDGFGLVLMAAPDMLEIAVEDYGAGITDAEQALIFQPFTQADQSSTREHGGAGLGLAVVKQYVEAHGGRVRVTSRVGEGSRFTIRIPVVYEL